MHVNDELWNATNLVIATHLISLTIDTVVEGVHRLKLKFHYITGELTTKHNPCKPIKFGVLIIIAIIAI